MKPPNRNATNIIAIPGAVNDTFKLSPFRVGIIPKTNRITPTIPPNNAIKEGAASTGFSKRNQLKIFEEFFSFPDFLNQIRLEPTLYFHYIIYLKKYARVISLKAHCASALLQLERSTGISDCMVIVFLNSFAPLDVVFLQFPALG